MEEEESEEEEDELPMYQEHYDALFSMDFVETKYPHDDTMRALGIFDDVELVPKNMCLAKFFSYRLESYKELTCEFLASMRFHKYRQLDRAELDQGWGWITFLARGERKAVTFRQLEILFGFTYGREPIGISRRMSYKGVWATIADGVYSSSRSKVAQIRSPVLRYVHKALANTFYARKATGTINEGEVKLLDMGIKPIISRTKDGKKIRGDRIHAGNLMPLIAQLLSYKTTAYSTRFQTGRKLSVGGVITPILCAAGVHLEKRRSTPAGWMDIKFCKTNLFIEHKELDGRFQFKFTHPLAGPSKLLLPNPELTTVLGAFVWRWFHVIRTSGSEDTTILVGLDPPARPASFQLDRAAFPGVKAILHMEVMEIVGKGPLRAPITLALEMEFIGVGWISLSNDPMASKA
ncbi:unnamed protein product [Microthlaspi erraticum]|uniref:Arabidopsis retrotransposon Orf1 C-terminal domain-containing protein n=1 Tax=Microthlaspi erraticum TaxID=1685480 RepID=A0A6D2KL34_9BRAS|nr:unnamed protein product [Microthlaspi erraticum]